MVYKIGKWDLKDIIEEKQIENNLKLVEQKVSEFETYKKKLTPDVDADTINQLIDLSEEIAKVGAPISIYADLGMQSDNKNERFIELNNKLKQINSNNSNRMIFFSTWWKKIDDRNADRILKSIKKNKYSMNYARRLRKYILEEEEEKIISIKDITGNSALVELHDMITHEFEFEWKNKKVSESEIMKFTRSQDKEERKQAYKIMLKKYEESKIPLAHIYQNIVTDYIKENIELRKFESPIAVRSLGEDIPLKAVDALISISKKNEIIFREFFEVKKKILKLKTMSVTDLLAPYPVPQKHIEYDEAIKIVLDTFNEFDSEFKQYALKIIDAKHIDSESRKGKYPSAFCMSFPTFIPYIMTNYKGQEEDVRTLIHELGHGIHSQYSYKNSFSEWHAPISLAETASVFSENLLIEREIEEEKDKNRKIAKLMSLLDDLAGTIQRQIRYTLFEIEAYKSVAKGCSQEDLHQIWLKTMREGYGKSVEVPDYYKYGWMRIPHFFQWPFYCYAYAFGNLLVLSLLNMYKKQGKKFVPKMKKILSYGGSKSIKDILKEVGIDIESEQFWQEGFNIIRERLEELKSLVN